MINAKTMIKNARKRYICNIITNTYFSTSTSKVTTSSGKKIILITSRNVREYLDIEQLLIGMHRIGKSQRANYNV